MVSRRQRKAEKVEFGRGLREFKARNETGNFGESRVRWRGLCALKWGRTWACQGGCHKQNMILRRQIKREEVMVGPG